MVNIAEAATVFLLARVRGTIKPGAEPAPKRGTDRTTYMRAYYARHYRPTGRRPGRPSKSGLSRKQLGSRAYDRALRRLRKTTQKSA